MYTHFGDYMNKVKIYFCLFLFIISFLYVGELFNKVNIFDYLMGNNKTILSNSINNKNTIKDELRIRISNSIESATPKRNIFFVSIFFRRRSSYPDGPLLSNQFQYPRQDQMTLNILL